MTSNSTRQKRKEFLLFVKILVKYLERGGEENSVLCGKAKNIILRCLTRNRARDQDVESLIGTINIRMRLLIGEKHWWQVFSLYHFYLSKRSRFESRLGQDQIKTLVLTSSRPWFYFIISPTNSFKKVYTPCGVFEKRTTLHQYIF